MRNSMEFDNNYDIGPEIEINLEARLKGFEDRGKLAVITLKQARVPGNQFLAYFLVF